MSTPKPEADDNLDPVESIKDDLADAKSDLANVDDIADNQMDDLMGEVGSPSSSTTQVPTQPPVQDPNPSGQDPTTSDNSDSSHQLPVSNK